MRISDWSSDVCSSDLPENIELNRIQLQYMGIAGTVLTVGRQRINLDDQRFVGSVGWRDNEQTFDVVRIENSSIRNLKIDLTYAWSDRSEEHTSELQSLMRISYAVFCLKKKKQPINIPRITE